jgi:hypothetical protein
MDASVITVEARVVGRRTPLIAGRRVSLDLPPTIGGAGTALRLRDLLALVVRQEVRALGQRREEQRLIRVLSPDQIGQGVVRGKVTMGSAESSADTPVSDDASIAVALQGFIDGLYFVFLDNKQQEDLDAPVLLRPASTLTFIRLVALAGG